MVLENGLNRHLMIKWDKLEISIPGTCRTYVTAAALLAIWKADAIITALRWW